MLRNIASVTYIVWKEIKPTDLYSVMFPGKGLIAICQKILTV